MTLPNNSKRKIFDGRYEILSIFGRGADSVVYHGRHITGAAQEVAIKVLVNRDGSSTLTDKLRREALTLVSCRHRYVVRLDDFHSIKDLCYLSMEFAPHGDLNKYMASLPNKRLAPEQVEVFLRQSLEAIDFVHATGVVHRDLKPENILVLNDKEIRLADFGLALLPGDEVQLDELRKAVGSFDYLAPEVLDGIRYDSVSDLYSLGVCFYEAASGNHPFAHAPIAERRDARRDNRIPSLSGLAPELPPHIAAVITSLMRFSATERFQSAADALKALGDKNFKGLAIDSNAAAAEPQQSEVNSDISIQPQLVANGSSPISSQIVSQTVPASPATSSKTEPANTDTVAAAPDSRQSSPTEKIDLERVKAIIARDSQRRATRDEHNGSKSTDDSPSISENLAAQAGIAPVPAKKGQSGNNLKKPIDMSGLGRSSLAPLLGRFIGIALAFAVLTVGGLYGYSAVFGPDKKSNNLGAAATSAQDSSEEATETENASTNDGEPAPSLLALSEGVYTGTVTGLFPDSHTPLALISNPELQQLTLLIGLDGWAPVTISTAQIDEKDSDGPTFRSNGLILKFNQESSSSKITGTVIDVVTGEAGTWQVAK